MFANVSSFPCGAVNHDSQDRHRCWGNQVAAGGFWEWPAAFGLTPSFPQKKPPSRHDLFATCSRLTPASVRRILKADHKPACQCSHTTSLQTKYTTLPTNTFQYLNYTHPVKVTPHLQKLSLSKTGILNQLLLLRYSRNTSFRALKWHEGDGRAIHMLMSWHRYCEANQHGIPSQHLHCKKCQNPQVIRSLHLYNQIKSNSLNQ